MFRIRCVLAALGSCLALAAPAVSEEYPFFVQPMTVQDVRVIADELDLSREQSLALLGQYADYNLAFGELQEKDVQKVMDHAMDLVMQFQWWGGETEMKIPPRSEITSLVDEGLRAIRNFGRIDDDFFDSIVPLLSDTQLARLECERHRRALERLQLLHRNIAAEINEGAAPDLFGILRRIELDTETEMLVDEVLETHAQRMLTALRKFERAGREVIDKVLDEIDRLGLREMDMMTMMAFFADEARQQELKDLFDVLSKPLQEAAASASRENLRALRSVLDVVPEDVGRDIRGRFIKGGYHQVGRGVQDARSTLVGLLKKHADQPEAAEIQDGIVALDAAFDSIAMSYMEALAAQRKLRTFAQLEGEVPMEAEDRVEALRTRGEKIAEQAMKIVERFAETEKESEEVAESKAGGGGGTMSREDAIAKTDVSALTAEQVEQFGRWLGADAEAIQLMAILHRDYEDKVNAELEQRGRAMVALFPDFDQGYAARRKMTREKKVEATKSVDAMETVLFDDLALALPDSIDRSRIERIRTSLQRSRRRHRMSQDDWLMRQQVEASIDLAAMILATDPTHIDPSERTIVLDTLIAYDEAVVAPVDELAKRMEAVRTLEERMWSDEHEEYDPEVRQALRKRWTKRRADISEAAEELAQLNRSMAEEIFAAVPEETSGMLRAAYERAAYPEIFGKDRTVDSVV
ncbi:MAG: hypothetical protein QGI75_05490, partial [Phycisphaerales bacterium]|nr:hypothetical protein [Phycisphaerales bacterium]